jgi:chromosome partitioning protein
MKTVTFLTQKGGSGKTTLAVHIAVAAQQAGERVAIADSDPQGSAASWKAARDTESPAVFPVPTSELPRFMRAALEDDISLTIIDTAPHAAPRAALAAAAADLILIPCRPTALDIAAAGASAEIVNAAEKPAVFVLNACPARAPEVAETREALTPYGLPVCSVEIGERRSLSRAIASGRAVTEFDPKGKASLEINNLWNWIKEALENGQEIDRSSWMDTAAVRTGSS